MLKEILNKHKIKLILLGDIFVFYLSLLLMLLLRYGVNILKIDFQKHFFPFTFLLIIWIIVFYIIDLYSYTNLNATFRNKKKFLTGIIINFILSLGIFYIFGHIFSITPKLNLVLFTIIFLIIDYFWRYLFSWFLEKKYHNHKILLVSSSSLNKPIIEQIEAYPQLGYSIKKYKKEELIKNTINYDEYSMLVVDSESFTNPEVLKKLYELISKNIEVIPLVSFYEKLLLRIPLEEIKEKWFIDEIKSNYNIYDGLKNLLDKFMALVGIIIFSPIFLIVAILVKTTSKGPILIRQKRVGKNEKIFTLYKFRSMFALSKDGQAETTGARWCDKDDPRITKVGKILRSTHVDELPQLFNVIKGDISFVGPRPERPEFFEILNKEVPHYLFRQIIKPGLTGWAQIKFRYTNTIIESKEKFEYDLYYIKNRNTMLDLSIILKTIQFVFTH